MPKTRAQKAETIKQLEEQLESAKSVIFVRQDGLNAKDEVALRKTLRAENIPFTVIKKTLFRRALSARNISSDSLKGYRGIVTAAFGMEDEVAPAKALATFRKTHEAIQFLGGMIGSSFMTAEETMAFAKLPGKKELIGQLVSVVAGPLRGLVGVLQGNLRGLVYALKAVQEKKA